MRNRKKKISLYFLPQTKGENADDTFVIDEETNETLRIEKKLKYTGQLNEMLVLTHWKRIQLLCYKRPKRYTTDSKADLNHQKERRPKMFDVINT